MQASDQRTKSTQRQERPSIQDEHEGAAAHSLVLETRDGGESSRHVDDSPPLRRTGRGMSMRRRIGLKIEADENGGHRVGDCNDKESEERGAAGTKGEDWWITEYKAPPPGHLGAHAVPVSVNGEEEKSPTAISARGRSQSMESNDHSIGRLEVTGTEISLSHIPKVHETPERANRKPRGGSDLYDASTSHSSPNQKRKIIDLQDCDTGSLPLMGVAKEPKRFHETNEGRYTLQLQEGESAVSKNLRAASVTPSKLLCPMKKIDLEAGSSSSTSTGDSEGGPAPLVASSATGKASESA